MGSKACGEPGLMLVPSVLHALRMAATAARNGLASLAAPTNDLAPASPRLPPLVQGSANTPALVEQDVGSTTAGTVLSALRTHVGPSCRIQHMAPVHSSLHAGVAARNNEEENNTSPKKFVALSAPATVEALKAACGGYKTVDILRAALAKQAAPLPAEWVLV